MADQIKFVLAPMGSAGDVHPFVWLGRVLQEAGHEVAVVVQSAMADPVARAGLKTLEVGSREEQLGITRNPDLWHPHKAFRLLARHFPAWAREMVPAIRQQVHPGKTVLVGASISFGARIVSELDQLPLVTVHLQPCLFMSPHDAPVLMQGMENLKKRSLWLRRFMYSLGYLETERLLRRQINRVRFDLGLTCPTKGILRDWAPSRDLILGLFPDWFGPPQPDWPRHAMTTRFPLYDESDTRPIDERLGKFLRAGPPPVLLTPGSANMHAQQFFTAGLEGCRQLGMRALLVTPHRNQLPSTIPESAASFDYVPFSQVFGLCAAVVHHGGIGTCAQGLAAGVPQLVTAMAHDQPDNGWRLRQLGVGDYVYARRFTPTVAAENLRHLINSKDVRLTCEAVRLKMKEQMSPEAVGRLLTDFGSKNCAAPARGARA